MNAIVSLALASRHGGNLDLRKVLSTCPHVEQQPRSETRTHMKGNGRKRFGGSYDCPKAGLSEDSGT